MANNCFYISHRISLSGSRTTAENFDIFVSSPIHLEVLPNFANFTSFWRIVYHESLFHPLQLRLILIWLPIFSFILFFLLCYALDIAISFELKWRPTEHQEIYMQPKYTHCSLLKKIRQGIKLKIWRDSKKGQQIRTERHKYSKNKRKKHLHIKKLCCWTVYSAHSSSGPEILTPKYFL